ncbi:AfsR/SARP family transcriptional regulator [Streptomyces sp. LP05-1]|uniref:AfsR/SARP family transcriptional regulator n=1 Tax=Streptomyces pyxinae TaxID=2970734 RepID=A0ABT2CK79_9ACTN|nr:AfsR/SARP family transcriptional regulator [Streptomyces sp. LP05-1]MCS0637821.1 AfsR/SARP family transcriptional regulator [Streptomyces sp. LP05-1]
MRFSILGPMSVTENTEKGDDRTPSAPKHRQMLALLLLNANRVVSMAQFVEELWEYSPPPRAVAAVHTYVMQLRRILQDGGPAAGAPVRLLTRDQGYLLRVRDGELDLHTYEHLIRAGRAAIDEGSPASGARQLRAAHAMWSGSSGVDAPAGPLLSAAFAALERDRADSLVQRVGAELRLGRHHELLAELSALVHLDPTDERLTGQLMLALYRSGRQADALDVFHRLRRALREELGTSPHPEIHRLITDILAGRPHLEPPATGAYRLSLDAAGLPPARPAAAPARPGRPRHPAPGPVLLGA